MLKSKLPSGNKAKKSGSNSKSESNLDRKKLAADEFKARVFEDRQKR